jgi:arabinogalactan endo-1,4-beta-galactosidase
MNYRVAIFLAAAVLSSCNKEESSTLDTYAPKTPAESFVIKGADISSYPEIEKDGGNFFNAQGYVENLIDILKRAGINTIRVRLWVDPLNGHSTLQEVSDLNSLAKSKGFRTLISIHYSDSWADPGQQQTPARWIGLPFQQLKDSVEAYTYKVASILRPDYLQLGNEINNGFLHPAGSLSSGSQSFVTLLQTCAQAARQASPQTQLVLHYAGYRGADWFFQEISKVDYDLIGLSYYPRWHGKSIDSLFNTMDALKAFYKKKCFIAETAYPFTLDYNDYTHNAVGLESQLILPDFPATLEGQADFIADLKAQSDSRKHLGLCYWGTELIAWKGPTAQDASPWENQTLFDFQGKPTPALFELGK